MVNNCFVGCYSGKEQESCVTGPLEGSLVVLLGLLAASPFRTEFGFSTVMRNMIESKVAVLQF